VKKQLFIFLFLSHLIVFSQDNNSLNSSYPTNYFKSPLNIPLILSGTFGELRTNHFHSGLDIKTNQREGLQVLASAEGYVSRISVSHWGFGKAIYITHPNGFTTVYGHLQKFSDRIETYIKNEQYKKESFEVQVFPLSTDLPVLQNEIIALSGSTGGFVGPHLHFEIRDTKSEKPINPLFFGIDISDSKNPRINTLIGYSLDEKSQINRLNIPTQLSFKKLENGDLLANKINAFGTIGFGINSFDQLDNAANLNGIFSLEMFVNGEKKHEFKATSFSFSESKLINLLLDYERLEILNQRIQKCYIEPLNDLSLYDHSLKNGYIFVQDGLTYNVEIIIKDFKGNNQKIIIPVIGKDDTILVSNTPKITPYEINYNQFHTFNKDGITVAFPKFTFYQNFYLDFDVKDSVVKVHSPILPLNNNYTLTFDVSNYSEGKKKQLYIASIDDKKRTSYETTVKKENSFYTSTKKLGNFTLLSDEKKPTITLLNFNDGQWLTNSTSLKVKISDTGSGIHSYRGEIDGAWILMEYNVKNSVLTYDLNDKIFTSAEHHFKIEVTDNVGNTNTMNATFFRKK